MPNSDREKSPSDELPTVCLAHADVSDMGEKLS